MDLIYEVQKNTARREVVQAVLTLPRPLTEACNRALLVAPQLVLTEADPLLFLRLENNNMQTAALKLALYWTKRLTCFGQRAFLPMSSLTGTGTLAPQEVAAMKHHCMQCLPNDKQGNRVYIINASKIASSLDLSSVRCLFYQLHLANETGRLVLLFDASEHTTTSLDGLDMFFKLLTELVTKILPLRVIRVHILSPNSTTTAAPSRMMSSALRLLAVQNSLSDQVVVTEESSPQELVRKLESFGLTREGLPPVLGGTLGSMPAAALAGQMQGAQEFNAQLPRFLAPQGLSIIDRPDAEALEGDSHSDAALQMLSLKRKALAPDEQEQNAKKKIKAAPAKRAMLSTQGTQPSDSIQQDDKQASRKSAIMFKKAPAATSHQPQDSNKKIKSSPAAKPTPSTQGCQPLDSASTSATEKVANKDRDAHPSSAPPPHQEGCEVDDVEDEQEAEKIRIKRRNAMYSRRKYERKKIEIEVMKEQSTHLKTQHSALLQEQQHLEQLLSEAEKCVKMHEEGGGVVHNTGAPAATLYGDNTHGFHASILAAAATAPPAAQHLATASSFSLSDADKAALGVLRNQEMSNFRALSTPEASREMTGASFQAPYPMLPPSFTKSGHHDGHEQAPRMTFTTFSC